MWMFRLHYKNLLNKQFFIFIYSTKKKGFCIVECIEFFEMVDYILRKD